MIGRHFRQPDNGTAAIEIAKLASVLHRLPVDWFASELLRVHQYRQNRRAPMIVARIACKNRSEQCNHRIMGHKFVKAPGPV